MKQSVGATDDSGDASGEGAQRAPAAGSTTARRIAIVYNPTKGDPHLLHAAVEMGLAEARAAAADVGDATWGAPLWLETTVDDSGHGLTRQAVDAGVDLVLVAGGDGTVRAAAAGLRQTGIPLAIIPLGTGNLLARNVGLPITDVHTAVRHALTGTDRAIDVGVAELTRANGASSAHVFLVMAGMGIDAAMIEKTNPQLKKRVGWLAYLDGGLRSMFTQKLHVHYLMQGEHTRSARVSTILAANVGLLPGNLRLIPDAAVDDGLLDVALLQPRTVFGWLAIWRRASREYQALKKSSFGRILIRLTETGKANVMTYRRGPAVRIDVERAEPVELDGDSFGTIVSAHFWADAGALVLRVPGDPER